MSNWWAGKVGSASRSGVANPNYPTGVGLDRQTAVHHYAQQIGSPLAQPEPDGAIPGAYGETIFDRAAQAGIRSQGDPMGGARETAQTGNCPGCGSTRYFSRQSAATGVMTSSGTVYPAPECLDCGYPRQQGALGVSAPSTGPLLPARQGAAPPPGSLDALRTMG